jgi:hypothetical protein
MDLIARSLPFDESMSLPSGSAAAFAPVAVVPLHDRRIGRLTTAPLLSWGRINGWPRSGANRPVGNPLIALSGIAFLRSQTATAPRLSFGSPGRGGWSLSCALAELRGLKAPRTARCPGFLNLPENTKKCFLLTADVGTWLKGTNRGSEIAGWRRPFVDAARCQGDPFLRAWPPRSADPGLLPAPRGDAEGPAALSAPPPGPFDGQAAIPARSPASATRAFQLQGPH